MKELPDGMTKQCYSCTYHKNDDGADLEMNGIWYAEGGDCKKHETRINYRDTCDDWEVDPNLLEICLKYPNRYVILMGPSDDLTILGYWDSMDEASTWYKDHEGTQKVYQIIKIDQVSK